ncbi:PTS sugar transporter subunit IIA [[Clostridium] innocuum]|uniref:PTS sugar transporter subunit IIA n=1 Tax=Clostridium innocuum TaxID=1522 RepID=UPI001EDEEFD2|nr:PTS sugar transporter subunit IIA [[Clostridium] innocuum]
MIEPITYVILNHGRFGEELIKSAELIAGKTEHVHAVSLLSGMSIEEYYEEVRDYLTGVQGEILVLADLYGGTPSNVGMMLQREFSLLVLCGVNLPMLIELILKRNNDECTIQELMEAGLEAAKASIIQPEPIAFDEERG